MARGDEGRESLAVKVGEGHLIEGMDTFLLRDMTGLVIFIGFVYMRQRI